MIRKRYQSTIMGCANYDDQIAWVRLSLYGKVIEELTGDLSEYHIVEIHESENENERADFVNIFLTITFELNYVRKEITEIN